MFKIIKTISECEILEDKSNYNYKPFYLDFCHDIVGTFISVNHKVENFENFKKEFLQKLYNWAEKSINEEGGKEEYYNCYGDEPWYPFCLNALGKDKYLKEIERIYCTPIIGQWNDIYISLTPNFSGKDYPKYIHIKYDNYYQPSILDLIYAHLTTWQDYNRKNTDINLDGDIMHAYSSIILEGYASNTILIVKPGIWS